MEFDEFNQQIKNRSFKLDINDIHTFFESLEDTIRFFNFYDDYIEKFKIIILNLKIFKNSILKYVIQKILKIMKRILFKY